MKAPTSKSEITNEQAMKDARRYQYCQAKPRHAKDKKMWVEELRLQVATIVSLTVQDSDSVRLKREYETLKVQLVTAFSHVIQ